MTERPILFNGPMVRAILDSTKTQTRRVVNRYRFDVANWDVPRGPGDVAAGYPYLEDCYGNSVPVVKLCPYGQPGDRMWVRETHAVVPRTAYAHSEGVPQTTNPADHDMAAVYRAGWDRSAPGRWRPSIHMPRWASRIALEITNVRVERVQDITVGDAVAEGLPSPLEGDPCGVCGFMRLWDSINAKRGYGWDANPWVWVIEFERIQGGDDD